MKSNRKKLVNLIFLVGIAFASNTVTIGIHVPYEWTCRDLTVRYSGADSWTCYPPDNRPDLAEALKSDSGEKELWIITDIETASAIWQLRDVKLIQWDTFTPAPVLTDSETTTP